MLGVTRDKVECYGKGQMLIAGSFATNGGTDPVASTIKGSLVSTVTWLSTGTWKVTLKCNLQDVISIGADSQINSAANIDTNIEIGAVTNVAGAGYTFVIRNNPGGAVADIAADASNRLNFSIIAQIGAVK